MIYVCSVVGQRRIGERHLVELVVVVVIRWRWISGRPQLTTRLFDWVCVQQKKFDIDYSYWRKMLWDSQWWGPACRPIDTFINLHFDYEELLVTRAISAFRRICARTIAHFYTRRPLIRYRHEMHQKHNGDKICKDMSISFTYFILTTGSHISQYWLTAHDQLTHIGSSQKQIGLTTVKILD